MLLSVLTTRGTDNSNSMLVSVIINAHNSAEVIGDAIESVLEQSYERLELIIWDNASDDHLHSVIESYGDPRIRYFGRPKQVSLYRARLGALAESRGDLVAWLDHDDKWYRHKLEVQVPYFEQQEIVACASDVILRRRDTTGAFVWGVSRTYEGCEAGILDAMVDYRLPFSSVVFRAQALLNAVPQNPPDFYVKEDTDLVMRVLLQGKVACIHSPLAEYRIHESNLSSRRDLIASETKVWADLWRDISVPGLDSEAWYSRQMREVAVIEIRSHLASGRRREALRCTGSTVGGPRSIKYGLSALFLPARLLRRYFGQR